MPPILATMTTQRAGCMTPSGTPGVSARPMTTSWRESMALVDCLVRRHVLMCKGRIQGGAYVTRADHLTWLPGCRYYSGRPGRCLSISDIPCTGDSKPVRMNVFIPSAEEVERANKRTRDIEENLASSRQQRQLEALHPEMGAKDQKMNPEMTRFSEGQSDSTTSETGETRRLDVPVVTRQYQDEMEALNKRLSTLKEK